MAVQSLDLAMLAPEDFGLFNIAEGEIRSVWSDLQSRSMEEGAAVFRLRFLGLQSTGQLSDVLQLDPETLPGYVYTAGLKQSDVRLIFETATGTSSRPDNSVFRVSPNRPNPFSTHTELTLEVPEGCDVTLRLYDPNGRLLRQQSAYYAAGRHTLTLDCTGTDASGILCCELTTPLGVLTRKIVRIAD